MHGSLSQAKSPIFSQPKLKLIRTRRCPKRDEKVTAHKKISTVDVSNNAIATKIGVINSNWLVDDSTPNKKSRASEKKVNLNKRKVGGQKKDSIISLHEEHSSIENSTNKQNEKANKEDPKIIESIGAEIYMN